MRTLLIFKGRLPLEVRVLAKWFMADKKLLIF